MSKAALSACTFSPSVQNIVSFRYLSRNLPKLPKPLETIVGNCLAHARRYFVDVVPNFPEPCRYVLESLGKVYGYDAQAEARGLSPEERLRFHQEHSQPVMDQLHAWLRAQFDEKRVEPNSGLGTAIAYVLRRWDRLTLFLRQAGAPLDSNIVERALKKAILHRRNSLFYKTENGAEVGDLFMSLIHTWRIERGQSLRLSHRAATRAPNWRSIQRRGCLGITTRPFSTPVQARTPLRSSSGVECLLPGREL